MVRIICQVIGTIFCILAIPLLLTPIPFGLIFLIIGLLFLIPSSTRVTKGMRTMRRKSRHFDSFMHKATSRAPTPYRRILRQTETDYSHF